MSFLSKKARNKVLTVKKSMHLICMAAQEHLSHCSIPLYFKEDSWCHPCAGAMLIFSVSFQFLSYVPRELRRIPLRECVPQFSMITSKTFFELVLFAGLTGFSYATLVFWPCSASTAQECNLTY